MSEEKFTNRRGHTISALKEAVNDLPEPTYKTVVPKPPRKRSRRALRLTRLQIRIFLIVMAICLLTPVVVGEYVRGTYGSNVSSAKYSVSLLFTSVLEQQKTSVTSKTLASADSQLSSIRDGLCPGGFSDNLAKLYPRAQQSYSDCAAYKSSVIALEEVVATAAAQMTYLEQLQPLLAGVSEPLEDKFAVLSSQQENWQTFVDGLNKLSVPLSFRAAHTGLVKEASAVRDQWIALVQASNAYDSAAFRAARTKLTESYTAFRAQAAGFSTSVASTQNSLKTAVSALQ